MTASIWADEQAQAQDVGGGAVEDQVSAPCPGSRAEPGYRSPGDLVVAVRHGVAVVRGREPSEDRRMHACMIVAAEALARYVRHGTEA